MRPGTDPTAGRKDTPPDTPDETKTDSRHLVDLRFVSPKLFGKHYFDLRVGKDRRAVQRKIQVPRSVKARNRLVAAFAVQAAFAWVLVVGLVSYGVATSVGCGAGGPMSIDTPTDTGTPTDSSTPTTPDTGTTPTDPADTTTPPVAAKGTFVFAVAWDVDGVSTRVIPTGTDHIDLRIRPGAGQEPELEDTINKSDVVDGQVTRAYDLEPGDGKILEIEAVAANGDIVAQVEVSIDIVVGVTTQVTATLDSTGIPNPVVTGSASPEQAAPGESITLTGTASDPDGTLAELAWDADGDGTFESTTTDTASGEFVVVVTPALGSYTAVFRATDNDGLVSQVDVPYVVAVPDPELELSTLSLSFDSVTNEATIDVSNVGGGDLTWTASTSDSWLDLSQTSGTNDATITATVTRSVLSAGVYEDATISFTSNGGSATVTTRVEVTRAEIIIN